MTRRPSDRPRDGRPVLADEPVSPEELFARLTGGAALVREAPSDGSAGKSVINSLWAHIADLRSRVDQVSSENRLLWRRVVAAAGRAPPVTLSPEAERHVGEARERGERDGFQAALLELEGALAGQPATEIAAAIVMLARTVADADPAAALELLARAQSLDATVAAARLVQRLATRTGDLARRAEAGRFILMNADGPSSIDHDLDRGWRYGGDLARALDNPAALLPPSGTAYPAPVFERALMALHSSLPTSTAGYTYRSHSLLTALHRQDVDVRCCTRLGYPRDTDSFPEPMGGFAGEDVVDGIRYRRIPAPDALRRSKAPMEAYLGAYADALRLIVRRERIHIVHTASNYVNAVAGLLAARDARRPFIHEVRGFWELSGASKNEEDAVARFNAIEASLEAGASRQADRVLTLNGPMKRELVERGVEEDRIVVVPNGIDPGAFSPLPPDRDLFGQLRFRHAPTIGYIGSFINYEGLDHLVAAMAMLKEREIPFNGLLVGDGEMLAPLRRMVEERGLSEMVRLPGRVPHGQVRRYYSLIDIAPFPRKPFRVCELVSPMKPFEAMAMAKAVVVSDVAALADMVDDGRTGMTFAKGNATDLADVLALLLRNDDLRNDLGQSARNWVLSNRTWGKSAAVIAQVYSDVAAEWAARRRVHQR